MTTYYYKYTNYTLIVFTGTTTPCQLDYGTHDSTGVGTRQMIDDTHEI